MIPANPPESAGLNARRVRAVMMLSQLRADIERHTPWDQFVYAEDIDAIVSVLNHGVNR